MIQIQLRRWLFLVVIYVLKLKRAYANYGNTILFHQGESQLKLRNLIRSARKNVTFFRENLPAIEHTDNLIKAFSELKFVTHKSQLKSKLPEFIDPSLVKEDTLMNFRKNKLSEFLKLFNNDIIFSMSTGGSTGAPLNFYISKNRGLKFVMQFFAIAKSIGWNEGEPHMACMQGGMYQQSNLISKLLPFIGTPAFVDREIHLQTAIVFAAHFKKHRPVILFSSPSFLSEIACLLEANSIKLPGKLKGIMCIGEMLMDGQRKIIESFFETRVYNIYASNEMGTMAVECHKHNGLHVLEASVFLENDDDFNIIATAFDSECLPFIKYKTGDIGKIEYQACSCGITGKKITDLKGRIEEYIIDKNENRIHASYLRQLLIRTNQLYNDVIINGQFFQKKNGAIHYKLQLQSEHHAQQIIQHIGQEIQFLCNLDSYGSTTVSVVPASGKFRFFYRED